jgi:acrosin
MSLRQIVQTISRRARISPFVAASRSIAPVSRRGERQFRIEPLEERQLLAVTSALAGGILSVNLTAADNVAITSSAGQVKINGSDPSTGAAAAGSITEIEVVASGNFDNQIDLSAVTTANGFTSIPATGAVIVQGGLGNDTITGSDFGDTMFSGPGVNVLTGGNGDDILDLSGGQIVGGDGGGAGFDVLRYIATNPAGETVALTINSGAERLEITGASGPDTFTVAGTISQFVVDGGGDGDTIDASGITNPASNVTLTGGLGNDTITGGAANDLIVGGGGSDVMTGNDGDDIFDLSGGTATVNPGAGTDTIRYIVTNPAGETVALSATATERLEVTGGSGPDVITVSGGASTFIVNGGGSGDTIDASGITNAAASVSLIGGAGDDTIAGGAAADRIEGNAGNDSLSGNGGNDTLVDDAGDDALFGGADDDTYSLTPGGADTITDSSGTNDSLVITQVGLMNTVTYNYTNANDGSVSLDVDGAGGVAADVITYAGLDPIANSGTATNLIFNLPAVADNARISDLVGMLRLESTNATFETTDFVAPSPGGSLTINMGAGADTLDIEAMPTGTTNIVNGDADNDTFNVNFTALSVALNGNAGANNTVVGPAAPTVWTLNGAAAGSITGGPSFTGINTVTGVASTDTFNVTANWAGAINGGGNTDAFNLSAGVTVGGAIDGGAGADTLDLSAFATARNVTLTALGGTDGFNGTEASVTGGFSNVDTISAPAATADSLTNVLVPAAAATWEIDGTNRFQSGGRDLNFTSFENLSGGALVDTFNVTLAHTGDLAGNAGADIFNLSAALTGSITGGTENDELHLTGTATVSGSFDADGGAADEIDFTGYTGARDITLTALGATDGFNGTEAAITGGFSNVNVITGSGNVDSLTNALVPAAAATWEIDGTNRFSSGGRDLAFTSLENLNGGSLVDTFNVTVAHTGDFAGNAGADVFNLSAALTGNIAGGADSDELNLSGSATVSGSFDADGGAADEVDFTGYAGGRNITLTALGATDGFNGTEAAITGGFSNVNVITGSGNVDSLTNALVPAAAATWEIDGTNRFQSGGRDLAFSTLENLNGGSLVDTFTVTAPHTGNLTGNGGNDVFTITGVQLTGGISGDAGDDDFNLAGAANVTGNIAGGADNDDLSMAGASTITGSFNGGAGTDSISFAGYTTARNVVLAALGSVDGFAGTELAVTGGFDNVNTIVGTTANVDSLTGLDAASVWTVSGANTYVSTNTLSFGDFETLTGGSSTDQFNILGVGVESGEQNTYNGGAGQDTFNIALTSNGNITTTAGTLLAINGGVQGAGERDTLSISATADTTPRNLTLTYANAASGDVDILGIGAAAAVDVNTVENINYTGNTGNDDTVTVVGTAAADDLTVLPLTTTSANILRGGAFNGRVPSGAAGIAGGSAGPDISIAGVAPTGLTVDGGTGDNGLTVQTPNTAQEIIITNTTVAPSLLIETDYANIGSTLNVITGSAADMVLIDLPNSVDPAGPLADFVRVYSAGGNDVVKFLDVGADQGDNVVNFTDTDHSITGPMNANESAFQLGDTECVVVLAGAGNDTVSNQTQTTNNGFAAYSVVDLGDGDDTFVGSNFGRKTAPPSGPLYGEVVYGGAGGDDLTAGTMGPKFLFADLDIEGVNHPYNGDKLNGSGNAQVNISAGAGDMISNHIGGLFGTGFTLDVITWLKARWQTGDGQANANALKCADWHTNYNGNDLGDLTSQSLANVDTSDGETWFEFEAADTGTLTATATFLAGHDVEVKIFDEHFAPLAWNLSTNGVSTAHTEVETGEEYYIRVRGNVSNVDLDLSIGQPIVVLSAPPVVSAISLGDSASGTWFDPAVGSGAQLATIPWSMDQIRVTFSDSVQVEADDLFISGVNVANYATLPGAAGFNYDAATNTATWSLAQPLASDKVLITLADDIHSDAGASLDGDWQNPATFNTPASSTFPSGNNTAGGSFQLRLNFLDGDVDRNGIVDLADVAAARDAISGGFNAGAADMDRNGTVTVGDMLHVIDKMFRNTVLPVAEPTSLPAPSPAAPQPAAAIIATAHTSAAQTTPATASPSGLAVARRSAAQSTAASRSRTSAVDAVVATQTSTTATLRASRSLRSAGRTTASQID